MIDEHNRKTESVDEAKKIGLANLGQLKDRKLALAYTCKVCSARNTKLISKQAYEKGVVIVKCEGCGNHHLIADNLGWWAELSAQGIHNIEDILAAKGENVRRIANESDMAEISELLNCFLKIKDSLAKGGFHNDLRRQGTGREGFSICLRKKIRFSK